MIYIDKEIINKNMNDSDSDDSLTMPNVFRCKTRKELRLKQKKITAQRQTTISQNRERILNNIHKMDCPRYQEYIKMFVNTKLLYLNNLFSKQVKNMLDMLEQTTDVHKYIIIYNRIMTKYTKNIKKCEWENVREIKHILSFWLPDYKKYTFSYYFKNINLSNTDKLNLTYSPINSPTQSPIHSPIHTPINNCSGNESNYNDIETNLDVYEHTIEDYLDIDLYEKHLEDEYDNLINDS